jgi:DNA-binding NarL/FixJ family response regulator
VAARRSRHCICGFRGSLTVLALETLISRVVRGGSWVPPSLHLRVRVSLTVSALETLISRVVRGGTWVPPSLHMRVSRLPDRVSPRNADQ